MRLIIESEECKNISDDPYKFVFQGGEEAYECLNLGMLNLWDNKDFVACVQSRDWIDEYEPAIEAKIDVNSQ